MANETFEKRLLTPREKEIYALLLKGFNIQEIAEKLFLATCTVATHRTSIFKKRSVNSIPQLLAKRIKELEGIVRILQTG